jgi:isopenicillin-N N-acyltransferase-like protein
LLTQIGAAFGAYCHGSPKPDAPQNLMPILDSPPVFDREIKNARLYWADSGNNKIPIVHVWGTPYEMGFAHGRILNERVNAFMTTLWDYFIDEITHEINEFAPNLPDWFVEDIATGGIEWALEKTTNITTEFTPSYFDEELKGLSDASGVDFQLLQNIHMLGELTKGACSMMGAWNEALASGKGLLQFRTLDWDMSGPFRDYPHITVYHPNDGNSFANVGWSGWVGSLTGMNDQKMAISEIGAAFADYTFGEESRKGIPFTYILRDVLQYDKSLDDSKFRMENANRTCNLILGVGDGKNEIFNSVRYSHSVADFFDDKNMEPGPICTEPQPCDWHPRIDNVVYHGMDWNCPAYTQRLGEEITKYYGQITPELIISDLIAKTCTGDVHNAVYDLTDNFMYVAVASPHGADSSTKQAYKNSYIKLDMEKLFAESKPDL